MYLLAVHKWGVHVTVLDHADIEVLESLGGSRATVHRGIVRTTGRVVVVKRATWQHPDVAAGLVREAAVLSRVAHRAVVRLIGTLEDDTGRANLLAHAPGGSLDDIVRRHGPLPAHEVADLGARLADGLAALHAAGVVHRDVHPGNILLDAELQPLLADLDHARDLHASPLPVDSEVVGHPDHVDHRLFSGAPADEAADLHSLGTTLWMLATGAPPPRPGPTHPVALPHEAQVPPLLRAVVQACTDRTVTDATELAGRLREVEAALAGALVDRPGDVAHHGVDGSPEGSPHPHHHQAEPPPVPDAALRELPPTPCTTTGPSTTIVRRAADGGTRRWGPPAGVEPTPLEPQDRATTSRRWPLAVAAGLSLAGVAVVVTVVLGGGDRRAGVAPPDQVIASQAQPLRAPPPCAGEAVGRAHVLADLDGNGCSEALRLEGGELLTRDGRWRMGAAGDVLLAGDWDGDGRWTPGLYRPTTGQVFLFDAIPADGRVESRPARQEVVGGTARVTAAQGHHVVTVTPAP